MNHAAGWDGVPFFGDEFLQGVGELFPGGGGFFWHLQAMQGGSEGGTGHDLCLMDAATAPVCPEACAAGGANAIDESGDAHEADLILAVDDELHEGGDVLDVGLLKEAQTTGDLERDAAAGQLHLNFHGVEVGAVEHGDLPKIYAFILKFKNPLGDKGRLGAGVIQRDERGQHAARRSGGLEALADLTTIFCNGGIGKVQDFGDGAVIDLDLMDVGAGMLLREAQDVLHISSTPGVDRLGVIADDHEIAVFPDEEVDHAALEAVGILELIDKDELELTLEALPDVVVVLQEVDGLGEQVIEVHAIGVSFLLFVEAPDGFDLIFDLDEVGEAISDDFVEAFKGIDEEGEDLAENTAFGKVVGSGINAAGGDNGVHEGFLVLAIHDRIALFETNEFRMVAQDAIANGVEGAAPEALSLHRDQALDTVNHLAGGFVGEGEQEDVLRHDAIIEEPGDAVGESAGLSRACASDDEGLTGRAGDGLILLLIELRLVIDLRQAVSVGGVERVFAGHGGADTRLGRGMVASASSFLADCAADRGQIKFDV